MTTLDSVQAMCLPLGASVSLLIMFFFFDSMQVAFVFSLPVLVFLCFFSFPAFVSRCLFPCVFSVSFPLSPSSSCSSSLTQCRWHLFFPCLCLFLFVFSLCLFPCVCFSLFCSVSLPIMFSLFESIQVGFLLFASLYCFHAISISITHYFMHLI